MCYWRIPIYQRTHKPVIFECDPEHKKISYLIQSSLWESLALCFYDPDDSVILVESVKIKILHGDCLKAWKRIPFLLKKKKNCPFGKSLSHVNQLLSVCCWVAIDLKNWLSTPCDQNTWAPIKKYQQTHVNICIYSAAFQHIMEEYMYMSLIRVGTKGSVRLLMLLFSNSNIPDSATYHFFSYRKPLETS